jgi:hypothetical protein
MITPCTAHSPFSGRTVDQREVVGVVQRGERVAQPLLAVLHTDQLDLGTGQLAIGADQVVRAPG